MEPQSKKQLGGSLTTNTASANPYKVAAQPTLMFDLAKTPSNGPEGPSTGVGGKTSWPLKFPDGILSTSSLGVLSASVLPKPATPDTHEITPKQKMPDTHEITPNVPDNKRPALSFLVDTIQLPLVPGLRVPREQWTSDGAIHSIEQAATPAEDEELQRRDGYIVGEEYSGPEFQPPEQVQLEEPPLFAMQNVSLLPPQARKPINMAVRQFTAQMQRAAVEYCTANNLNCNEQHALETAISVALRTSPTASMFRQISASLSAVEVIR